jgi:hypothetical protein
MGSYHVAQLLGSFVALRAGGGAPYATAAPALAQQEDLEVYVFETLLIMIVLNTSRAM